MRDSRPTLGALLPALALLIFSLFWSGALVMWPRDGQPVAAIFPPAAAEEAAMTAAIAAGASSVQGFGAWPGVVVTRSDDPAFAANLYRQGALLVVRAAIGPDCRR